MGGQAFLELGVIIPRMEPNIYEKVKHAVLRIVSRSHERVAVMPEAPDKSDFGDVDLVLESACTSSASSPIKNLARDLDARHIKENHPGYSLAVPRPDSEDGALAQVDLLVCPPGFLEWSLFLHGYGDLGQILGAMNHGCGFTSNNNGFHVRIQEQEAQNWKASQVFLSKDTNKVMDFLRLDKDQFAKGFGSEEQLFKWLSTCRLFNKSSIEKRKNDAEMRQRMKTRPMFRRFVNEYLPSLPSTDANDTETRDTLLQDALSFFDRSEEFNSRRAKVLIENTEEHAWCVISSTILRPLIGLEGKRLNEVIRAFKRFIAFKQGEPHICDEAEMDVECQARFAVMVNDADEIKPGMRQWILDHWEEVRSAERQRIKSCSRAAAQSG